MIMKTFSKYENNQSKYKRLKSSEPSKASECKLLSPWQIREAAGTSYDIE